MNFLIAKAVSNNTNIMLAIFKKITCHKIVFGGNPSKSISVITNIANKAEQTLKGIFGFGGWSGQRWVVKLKAAVIAANAKIATVIKPPRPKTSAL